MMASGRGSQVDQASYHDPERIDEDPGCNCLGGNRQPEDCTVEGSCRDRRLGLQRG